MAAIGTRIIGMAAALWLAGPACAAPPDPGAVRPAPPAFAATNRPRIGLVLGGGGAKGFAHIGVIEELERRHIPVDVIAGTSMGAVVGSMYAIGNDAGQIKAIAREIDWVTIFNDRADRNDLSFRRKREVRDVLLNYRLGVEDGKPVLPQGVLGGQRLFATVQQLLAPWRATEDFNNLPIPYRAVATDIVTGRHVVMDSGNLSTAVFASMSIPSAFPPVKRDGLLLVDGGISDNLPVDVARQMGVDVVIVVDVGEPPQSADKITNVVSVFNQMQLLLGYDAIRRQRESLGGRDVLVEPDITGLSVAAFNQSELAIERGRAAAQKVGDRLSALAVGDTDWAAYLATRRGRASPAPIRIDKVEVATNSKVPPAEIRALVRTRPGDTLDGKRMYEDVATIYKLDEFDRVDYHVDIADGSNTLVLNAEGARGTRRYFQTGLILASNFGKTATFDLGIGYTDRDFLRTGAEWRGFVRVGNDVLLETSLYKQFGRFFVEPIAGYQRYSSVITQQGSQTTKAVLQVSRVGVGIDGGMLFGNWGELRGGMRFGGLNPGDEAATIGVNSGWNTDVDWRVGFTVDTLDALTFPRSGMFAQAQYIDHVTALGGKFTRNNVSLFVQKPFSWDRTTVVLGARLATTTNAGSDFIGDFQLGGFLNLSGLQRNSLIGPQLLFGRAVAYHRLSDRAPILDLPVYLGGSIEVGNVWSERGDISLGSLRTAASAFVAADTPIGPFWLAYGLSGSNGSIYLVLGRVF